jgi:hypothetical protein
MTMIQRPTSSVSPREPIPVLISPPTSSPNKGPTAPPFFASSGEVSVQWEHANSVAPLGLVFLLDTGPTADAVGYRLSVLRTCRTAPWELASCASSSQRTKPRRLRAVGCCGQSRPFRGQGFCRSGTRFSFLSAMDRRDGSSSRDRRISRRASSLFPRMAS